MKIDDHMRCIICNRGGRGKFDIPGMRFTFLQGEPLICEECLGERLGLGNKFPESILELIEPAKEIK